MRNALAHVGGGPFGAGAEQCVARRALALVCYFYLPGAFVAWGDQSHAFKARARKLWYFLF